MHEETLRASLCNLCISPFVLAGKANHRDHRDAEVALALSWAILSRNSTAGGRPAFERIAQPQFHAPLTETHIVSVATIVEVTMLLPIAMLPLVSFPVLMSKLRVAVTSIVRADRASLVLSK